MGFSEILHSIDQEIDRLTKARKLISGSTAPEATVAPVKKKKHRMTAEGRARIAAATRKRWAAVKAAQKGTKKAA